ncbi:MAG: CHAT domain-containing tetratricopeptide repeat protein [Bacteroidota bacterium]
MELYRKGDSLRMISDGYSEEGVELLEMASRSFEEMDSVTWYWRSELIIVKEIIWGGKADKGLERAQRLTKSMEEAKAQDSLLAQVHYLHGAANHSLRRPKESVERFKRSVNLFTEAGIGDKRLIEAKWFLALLYDELGIVDLAAETYQDAICLAMRLQQSRYRTRTVFALTNNMGKLANTMGNPQEALRKFLQSQDHLARETQFFDNFERTYLYNGIAGAYYQVLDYENALEFCELSLSASDNFVARNRKALIMKDLGRFQESFELHRENLIMHANMYNESPLWDDYDKGVSLQSLGFLFFELSELDSAEKYYLLAENWNRSVDAPDRQLAIILMDLGELYTAKGNHSLAARYLSQSLHLSPKSWNHNVFHKLSVNYFHSRMADSSLFYGKAAVLSNAEGAPIQIRRGLGLGGVEDQLKRYQWLLELYEEFDSLNRFPWYSTEFASQLHHQLRERFLFSYHPKHVVDQTSFIYQEGIRNSLKLAERQDPKWKSQSFTFSEWSKAQSLHGARQGAEARSYANIPPDLLDLENDLLVDENYARSQIQRFGSADDADSSYLAYYKDKLFRVQHGRDSLRNVFEIDYPRYHQIRYASDSISVQDVQRQLANNQAFIEYYVGDTVSYVFTITQDQYEVKQIDLVNDSLIFNLRASFKANAQLQSPDVYQGMAFPIYERYLKPVIEELGSEIDELIIVPDGNLSYFPLGALVTRKTGNSNDFRNLSYLMDDFTIHYAYSASLYFNEFSSLSDNNDLLAFAPSYETTLQDTTRMKNFGEFRSQIRALAHTTPEVTAIGEYFDGQTFLGEVASEQNFKAHLDDPGILHLAMHAIVDDEDPMMSRLLFYNGEDTVEDGYLHAFEIYNMRIPSKMTVLSACETGYGKMAKGEGAMSLARAFAYAGSPSIVMSHWQVDDQSTAELMTHFYKHLSKGESKGAALRMARQDFLETADISKSHPFFWASFVAMGDDAPLRPSVNWALLGFVIAICLLVIATLLIRRRTYL